MVEEVSMLSSSSDVVIHMVAASGASVATRKMRISLLRRRFTRFATRGPPCGADRPDARVSPAVPNA